MVYCVISGLEVIIFILHTLAMFCYGVCIRLCSGIVL